jgi:preprotein translocase subunit SecG
MQCCIFQEDLSMIAKIFQPNNLLSILFVAVCLVLSVIILMQEGKSEGLGSISGMADSYWGKNRGRSVEGRLEKLTKFIAAAFLILAFVLNIVK